MEQSVTTECCESSPQERQGRGPGNWITSSPSLSIVSPSSGLFSSPASTQSDATLGMCITIDSSLGCKNYQDCNFT